MNGIADGIFPSIRNSVKTDDDGNREINRARLTASVLAWLAFIALLKGWLPLESVLKFIQTLIQ